MPPEVAPTSVSSVLAEDSLSLEYRETRQRSREDCASLAREDFGLQAAAFASPPKWHLAHTTWFFETFLLKPFVPDYESPDERYAVLFNSYYNGVGEQHPRDQRGLLSRPLLEEVLAYRKHVDEAMSRLLESVEPGIAATVAARCVLGLEHERQHQELMYTDIKYSLSANPLLPAFAPMATRLEAATEARPLSWDRFPGGLREIGHDGPGFAFDNEFPPHRVYLEPYELADRLVTNSEFQSFVDDGGYERPELWLADGWTRVVEASWKAPLHWIDRDGRASEFTLTGLQTRHPAQPVCHLSGYEADAYARWAGARLPTEAEWECAARDLDIPSAGRDTHARLHPQAAGEGDRQYYGTCWQWTRSAYGPYPGYRPAEDVIGEYNGKFMSSQWVLRGGSCVTWSSQARPSYRNFFYPTDRWQFTGLRLAR